MQFHGLVNVGPMAINETREIDFFCVPASLFYGPTNVCILHGSIDFETSVADAGRCQCCTVGARATRLFSCLTCLFRNDARASTSRHLDMLVLEPFCCVLLPLLVAAGQCTCLFEQSAHALVPSVDLSVKLNYSSRLICQNSECNLGFDPVRCSCTTQRPQKRS